MSPTRCMMVSLLVLVLALQSAAQTKSTKKPKNTGATTLTYQAVEPINVLRGGDGVCNIVPDVYLPEHTVLAVLQPNHDATGGRFPDVVIGIGGFARLTGPDGEHIEFELVGPSRHLVVRNPSPGFNNLAAGFPMKALVILSIPPTR